MAEANRIIEAELPALGRDDLDADGLDSWLVCQIFRREAEAAGIAGESRP